MIPIDKTRREHYTDDSSFATETNMLFKKITDPSEMPREIVEFKRRHFKDVFGGLWGSVYDRSPAIADGEEVLVVEIDGEPAGWVYFQRRPYFIKFRGFAVRPEFRSMGISKILMGLLADIGIEHHRTLVARGEKPADIGLMFLKSQVYFNAEGEGEAFAFGRFLKKAGFAACAYNMHEIDAEEVAGIDAYKRLYPDMKGRLKVFKKAVVDTGVRLKDEAESELMRLSPEELAVVMHGLDVKLGNYGSSGRLSYRYDLCPICAYTGSSEQDSDNCKKCCIRMTCMEPFRDKGRFKEDYEVSRAYFEAMRDFLRQNKTSR